MVGRVPLLRVMAEDEYAAAVAKADQALQRRSAVVSGHRIGPRIVWTLQPMNDTEIRALVSGGGNSPLIPHEVIALPRQCINWAGAPHFAQYAYLVNVEVHALFPDGQR